MGALAGCVLLMGALWWQSGRVSDLQGENDALRLAAAAAAAKQTNISEDKESDDEIDNIPDDRLRHVPDRWLRPPAPGGSGD